MIMLSIHCWIYIQTNLSAKLYFNLKNFKYSQGHDLDIFVWFYHLQLVASRMDTLLCIEISFSLFPCIQRRKTEKVLFLSFSVFSYFKFASLRCTLYWFYFSLFRLFSVCYVEIKTVFVSWYSQIVTKLTIRRARFHINLRWFSIESATPNVWIILFLVILFLVCRSSTCVMLLCTANNLFYCFFSYGCL